MKSSAAAIFLAHGSRDPRWRQPFEKFLQTAASRLPGRQVRLAYMEMCEPTLLQVAEECIQNGAQEVTVFPLFLSGGGHVKNDIPHLVEELKTQFPSVKVRLTEALGETPEVHQAFLDAAVRLVD
jgi:sirohydrochlorin cobaltochelatase